MRSLGGTEYRSLITRPGHLPLHSGSSLPSLCCAGPQGSRARSHQPLFLLYCGGSVARQGPWVLPQVQNHIPPHPHCPWESSGLSSGLYVRLYLASLGECVQCTAGLLVCPAQGLMVLTLLMISLGTVSLCLFSRAGLAVCRRPDDTQAPYSPIILACGI